jgi:hypothetical protein
MNNVTPKTINNINSAVAVALTSSRSVNKTKEDYFYKNLKTFKQ